MARGRGGVRLSIYTTFNDAGAKQAARAMKAFTREYGQIADNGKRRFLDAETEALARRSIELDQAAAKMRSFSKGLESAGRAFLPVTALIAGVAAASTQTAIAFESSFAGVRKTVDATEADFQRLAKASREMAMVKPVDVNDVNRIMELGGQLGIATENLVDFTAVIADLDVATDMNVDDASMQLARFINIMGTAQGDIGRLGSSIVGLGNNSATTESQIMEMAMRIAGSARQINLTESQTLGLAAALSSVGIEAEAGGTAISKTMTAIDKDVALNTKSLSVWARTAGVSVDQFASMWKTDAAGALELVFRGMGNVRDEGGNLNILLEELGVSAIREADMMKRMSSAADLLSDSINTSNTAWRENSALTEEAAKRYETTESKVKMAQNRIKDVGIDLGGPLADAIIDVIDASEPLIRNVAKAAQAFADMDKESQRTVLALVGVAAAFGPVLIGSGKIVSSIATVTSGYAKLTAQLAKAAAEGSNTAKVVGTALPLGLKTLGVGLAIAGAAWVAHRIYVQSYSEAMAEADAKMAAMYGSLDQFKGALEATQPTIADSSQLLSEFGNTASDIDQTIAEIETKITAILSRALAEQRQLRADEIADIENYLGQLDEKAREKLAIFASNVNAVKDQINAIEVMTPQQANQAQANLQAALDEQTAAIQAEYQRRYGINENQLRTEGEAGRAAYNERKADLDAWLQSETAAIQASGAEGASAIDERLGQFAMASVEGWLALDQAINEALPNGVWGGEVADIRLRLAELDLNTATGLLQVAATARAQGKPLSDSSKFAVTSILTAFEDLPPSLEDTGVEALRALVDGLEDDIPALKRAGTMNSNEIIAALRTGLDLGAGGGEGSRAYRVGVDATQAVAVGITDGGQLVSQSASTVAAAAEAGYTSGVSGSYGWGEHMVMNLSSGITRNAWRAEAAAAGVATRVAQYLQHSRPPRVGALKDELTWFPHMMQNLARSIDSSAPILTGSAARLAQRVSDTFSMDPTFSPALAGGFAPSFATSAPSQVIHINIGGLSISPDSPEGKAALRLADLIQAKQMQPVAGRF